jgi:hypothetical protein
MLTPTGPAFKEYGSIDRADQPQEHVDQIYPDGVLHPLNSCVAFGVLMNVHLAKYAKDCDPQDTSSGVSRGPFRSIRDKTHNRIASQTKKRWDLMRGTP